MTRLLEIKEWLKGFFEKYDVYAVPILKFLLALITFITINTTLGFMSTLKSPIIVIILSLFCSILPITMTIIFAALFLIAHFYAVSIEVAIIGIILMILMMLLYFRFNTKDSYILILTPFTYIIHLPVLAPIVVGLIGNPLSAIAVGCGVVLYYFIIFVKDKAAYISGQSTDNMIQKINYLVDGLIKNKAMMMTLVAFTAVILLMYFIRKLSKDYSWSIAIGVGALTYIFIMLIGDFFLDVPNNILALLVSTMISSGIAIILQFFMFSVDYTRTEYVQFEDDEYYYYVKAVPKISIAKPSFRVQRINPQKKKRNTTSRTSNKEREKILEEFDHVNEKVNENQYEEPYDNDDDKE